MFNQLVTVSLKRKVEWVEKCAKMETKREITIKKVIKIVSEA